MRNYHNPFTSFEDGGNVSMNLYYDRDGHMTPAWSAYTELYDPDDEMGSFLSSIYMIAPIWGPSSGSGKTIKYGTGYNRAQHKFNEPNKQQIAEFLNQWGLLEIGDEGTLFGGPVGKRNYDNTSIPRQGTWIGTHVVDIWKAKNDLNVAIGNGSKGQTIKNLEKKLNDAINELKKGGDYNYDIFEYLDLDRHRELDPKNNPF